MIDHIDLFGIRCPCGEIAVSCPSVEKPLYILDSIRFGKSVSDVDGVIPVSYVAGVHHDLRLSGEYGGQSQLRVIGSVIHHIPSTYLVYQRAPLDGFVPGCLHSGNRSGIFCADKGPLSPVGRNELVRIIEDVLRTVDVEISEFICPVETPKSSYHPDSRCDYLRILALIIEIKDRYVERIGLLLQPSGSLILHLVGDEIDYDSGSTGDYSIGIGAFGIDVHRLIQLGHLIEEVPEGSGLGISEVHARNVCREILACQSRKSKERATIGACSEGSRPECMVECECLTRGICDCILITALCHDLPILTHNRSFVRIVG